MSFLGSHPLENHGEYSPPLQGGVIGGWLADYCNTRFLVDSKQAKATIKYQAVPNAFYKSLADLIGPFGMSAENSGDVWEQLCWHAFEHGRGAFVLSVIWNTTYRCLHSEMNSASVSQPSVSHTASLYQNSVRDAASAAAQEDSEMKNTDNPYEVDWGDDARSSLPDTASVSQPSARVAASAAAQEDSGMEDVRVQP